MSEAVLDDAIEQIADGLTVDWNAIEQRRARPRERSGPRAFACSTTSSTCIATPRWTTSRRRWRADAGDGPSPSAAPTRGANIASPTRSARAATAASIARGIRSSNGTWRSRSCIAASATRGCEERLLQEGRALAKIQPQQRRPRARRRGAWRSRRPVHGVRAREDAGRHRARPGEDERGRGGAHRRGSVPRAVGRASRRLHPSRRQGQERHARRHRPDRADGLRHRPRRRNQQSKNDRAGTPLYMAPEVLEGEQASARSDVYSLGVLLYHLVTGDYPVRAASVDELRDAHAQPPASVAQRGSAGSAGGVHAGRRARDRAGSGRALRRMRANCSRRCPV